MFAKAATACLFPEISSFSANIGRLVYSTTKKQIQHKYGVQIIQKVFELHELFKPVLLNSLSMTA